MTVRRRLVMSLLTLGLVLASVIRTVPATPATGRTVPSSIDVPDPVALGAPVPSGSPSAGPPSAAPSATPSTTATSSTTAPSRKPVARATTRAPAAPATTNVASRLTTLPAGTRQVIVVTGDGYATTTATLQAFAKVNGVWQPAFGAMAARIGTHGFSDQKVEGDETTPTGVYGIGSVMYGIGGDPGVRYAYHQLVSGDYWDENPASPAYNSFVHGADPGAGSEALWQVSPQYTHFAVINYNIPVRAATPARGSAIFLHQMVAGHSTAGCVSLAAADLVTVLDWLDPSASPRIVLSPVQELGRY